MSPLLIEIIGVVSVIAIIISVIVGYFVYLEVATKRIIKEAKKNKDVEQAYKTGAIHGKIKTTVKRRSIHG